MSDNSLQRGRRPNAGTHRTLLSLPDVSPASMIARQKAAFAEMLRARAQTGLADELTTKPSPAAGGRRNAVTVAQGRVDRQPLSAESDASETDTAATVALLAREERSEAVGETIAGNSAAAKHSIPADSEVTLRPAIRFGALPSRIKRTGVIAVTLLALWFVVGTLRSTTNKKPESSVAGAKPAASQHADAESKSAQVTTELPAASAVHIDAPAIDPVADVPADSPSMEPPPTLEVSDTSPVTTSPADTIHPVAEKPIVASISSPASATAPATAPATTDSASSLGQSDVSPTNSSYPATAYPTSPLAGPAHGGALSEPNGAAASPPDPTNAGTLSSNGYPQTSPENFLYPAEMPGLPLTPARAQSAGVDSSYPQTNYQPTNSVPATQLQGQIGRVPTGTIR